MVVLPKLQSRGTFRPGAPRRRWVLGQVRSRDVVFAALWLALLVRIYRLAEPSIWWDEGYSAFLAGLGWRDVAWQTAQDIHPPAYYLLLKAWTALAGTSELSLRFLSVLISLLVIPITFALVRRMLNPTVAVVAALLLAVAPYQVAFAQEARMYPLEALLGALLVWLTFGLTTAEPTARNRATVGLAMTIAAALYVDYFPILLVAALGTWTVLAAAFVIRPAAGALGVVIRFALASFGGVVLYAPWLRIGLGQVSGYGLGRSTAPDPAGYVGAVWTALVGGPALVPTEHVLEAVLMAAIVLAGWLIWLRQPRPDCGLGSSLALLWALGPPLALALVLLFRPFFHVRYLSVAGPGAAVLVAVALVAIWGRARWGALAAALPLVWLTVAGLMGYHSDIRFARDDTRSTAAFLASTTTPNDVVLWQTPYPFLYYYRGPAPHAPFRATDPDAEERLAELTSGRERVFWQTWYESVDDPAHKTEFLLARGGRLLGEREFPGYRVSWYAAGNYSVPELNQVSWDFDHAVSARAVAYGVAEGLRQAPADGAVWVRTRWQLAAATSDDVKHYVRLLDASGVEAGRVDGWLYDGRGLTTRFWHAGDEGEAYALLRLPAGTPPGRYGVWLGAYVRPGQQLGLLGGATAEARIGEIEVVAPRGPQSPPEGVTPIEGPVLRAAGHLLKLIGLAAWDPAPVVVGQGRPMRLLWQVVSPQEVAGPVVLRVGAAAEPLDTGFAEPLDGWPTGALVWQRVTVRAQAAGSIPVTVESGLGRVPLGVLDVRPRSVRRDVPSGLEPATGRLAQGLHILGYRTNRRDGRLELEVYWRAAGPFAGERKSFVHLLDEAGKLVAQADGLLGEGSAPADALVPDEVLVDRRALSLPGSGPFRVAVGVYDGATGAREPLEGGGDMITLLTVDQ